MKKILCLSALFFFIISCQKAVDENISDGTAGTEPGNPTDSTSSDSSFSQGDLITYEIITKDTGGWFGIWNDSTGNVTETPLDSVSFGSPLYNKSGWKYSFKWNGFSTQLMMSVAARTYNEDITINIYRNNELIKSATNDQMKGVAKILYNIKGDSLQGTAQQPVLTYEALLDNMDSSKFEYNGWAGDWTCNDPNYILENRLLVDGDFAIPSGWRYSFKPLKLPFTMSMQTFPYTMGGSIVTLNFYVNGKLVKTNSSGTLTYPPVTYEVL